MRLLIGIFVGLVILSGCTSARSPMAPEPTAIPVPTTLPSFNPVARIFASLTGIGSEYDLVRGFPAQPNTVPCVLWMYTPPRLDGTSGEEIPATCTTSVVENADTWIVRFTETWDTSDFRSVGDRGQGSFQHTWEFTLGRDGQIRARRHFGQFPPQYVHTPFS